MECAFGAEPSSPRRPESPPPMRHRGAKGVREAEALARSFCEDPELLLAASAPTFSVGGVQAPSTAQLDAFGRSVLPRGVRRTLVYDERGALIAWPWERGAIERAMPPGSGGTDRDPCAAYFADTSLSHDELGSHAADATLLAGMRASTRDGNMGERATGVLAWKKFNAKNGRAALRPIDPRAPLWVKLEEEKWAMRFIAELIDARAIAPNTARTYFSEASGWHRRRTGIASLS